jgi:YihY family inner membrane protein
LRGTDAWRTLATIRPLPFLRDAVVRLRSADGFSHSRSLAFATSLVLVQGLIVLVGLAAELGQSGFNRTILGAIGDGVPQPARGLLSYAFSQAQRVGSEHRSLPLALGLVGTLVTAATAMAQLIRGVNRLYGIESDGPFLRKYSRASWLTLLVLAALVAAGSMFTVGRDLGDGVGGNVYLVWRVLRWPVAVALVVTAFGALLRFAPARRQPRWSWLMFGASIGVASWVMVTIAFGLAFRASSSFGSVYGPLAGVVALQLWTFSSSVAIFFGVACAAQLEAVRSDSRQR